MPQRIPALRWFLAVLSLALLGLGNIPASIAAVTPKMQAGQSHTVVLKSDGTVWAWGGNGYGGLLGVGSSDWRVAVPAQVPGLSDVVDIATGELHTLALKSDGTVWGWGNNGNGQLGDGTTTDRNVPVQVPGLTGVTALAAGSYHSLALSSDGTIWAWGANNYGQLGDGTATDHSSPVPLSGPSQVVALAAGGYHTLALTGSGIVWGWGDNSYGQLGDGSTLAQSSPVPMAAIDNVTAIAAGWKHSLALKNDGTLWGWGLNSNGQLGDGSTTDRLTPVQVYGLSDVSTMAAGGGGGAVHSVAVKSDGTVWTWGQNWFGQLGDGTTFNRSTPGQVIGLNDVTSLTAGGSHSLALTSDGLVWAWGINSSGQLGDGTETDRYTPVQVSNFNVAITAVLSDSDRIFRYAEAAYPQFLSPGNAASATLAGYYYRFYPGTSAYVATANGFVYYLGPLSGNQILSLGSVEQWLALAAAAGY